MSRYSYLCRRCKLDKTEICDYECMQCHFRYCFCPRFINDDGKPITNAELLVNALKNNDEDFIIENLWDKLTGDEFENYWSFKKWLKSEAVY